MPASLHVAGTAPARCCVRVPCTCAVVRCVCMCLCHRVCGLPGRVGSDNVLAVFFFVTTSPGQLCDLLGGAIGLERDDVSKRTVFWFCIPVVLTPAVVGRLGTCTTVCIGSERLFLGDIVEGQHTARTAQCSAVAKCQAGAIVWMAIALALIHVRLSALPLWQTFASVSTRRYLRSSFRRRQRRVAPRWRCTPTTAAQVRDVDTGHAYW